MSDTRALEMGLVCTLPCAYPLGSILPWPPELPGTSNWSTGDVPTSCAYLAALGERLESMGKELARMKALVREIDGRTIGSAKF